MVRSYNKFFLCIFSNFFLKSSFAYENRTAVFAGGVLRRLLTFSTRIGTTEEIDPAGIYRDILVEVWAMMDAAGYGEMYGPQVSFINTKFEAK